MFLSCMEHLAEKAVSEKVRLDASTRLLDRAGLVPPKPHEEREANAPLHEMTIDELRQKVEQWLERVENDCAARAKIVTSTPDPAEDLVG